MECVECELTLVRQPLPQARSAKGTPHRFQGYDENHPKARRHARCSQTSVMLRDH